GALLTLRTLPRTPFPYTTLFRSDEAPDVRRAALAAGRMLATAGETGRALAGLLSDTVLDAKQSDRVRQMAVEAISDLREVRAIRSEEHTSELQSRENIVCRLLPE